MNVQELYDYLLSIMGKGIYTSDDVNKCMELSQLKEEDIDELIKIQSRWYGMHTFGELIFRIFSLSSFYKIMDHLKENCPAAIFNEIIDFDGKRKMGNILSYTLIFPSKWKDSAAQINIYFDIIDRYYDGKYYMLYPIFDSIKFDKRNKAIFLQELEKRNPTAAQFDMALFGIE